MGRPAVPQRKAKTPEEKAGLPPPQPVGSSWQPRVGRQRTLSSIVVPEPSPSPTPVPVETGLKRNVRGRRRARQEGARVIGTKDLGPV